MVVRFLIEQWVRQKTKSMPDLQEGFYEASFPEEDMEEDMVMNLVPVRSYRVNLRVRKVRKGKLEFIYEEELEKEEL